MLCAYCKKPATMPCGGCKGAPTIEGDGDVARYCSIGHQSADRKRHRPTCRRLQDRKTLYRVGDTAQKFFYIYRELTWCELIIEEVVKKGDDLHMRGNAHQGATWSKDYKPFPSHLIPAEEDREALLSYSACRHAFGFMLEVVAGMLDDIVSDTLAITYKAKSNRRRMTLSPSLDPKVMSILMDYAAVVNHDIIKITLRSGETFAIDLAGAQYGHHEPVIPWQQYEQERIRDVVASVKPPSPSNLLSFTDYSPQRLEYLLHAEKAPGRTGYSDFLEGVNIYTLEWQLKEKFALGDMLKLAERDFVRRQKSLVDYVEWRLQGSGLNPSYTANGRRLIREGSQSLSRKS